MIDSAWRYTIAKIFSIFFIENVGIVRGGVRSAAAIDIAERWWLTAEDPVEPRSAVAHIPDSLSQPSYVHVIEKSNFIDRKRAGLGLRPSDDSTWPSKHKVDSKKRPTLTPKPALIHMPSPSPLSPYGVLE
jgi:hypothetical protein